MVFGYDVPVKFSIEGACKTASVHLSGYFQPGPDDDDEDDDEDGDDDGMPQAYVSCFCETESMPLHSNILNIYVVLSLFFI
jgi:hypothetical protein